LEPDGEPVVTVMILGEASRSILSPSGGGIRNSRRDHHDEGFHGQRRAAEHCALKTHDSASMLLHHVDINLAAYPMIAWRWFIELPIRCPLDEGTRDGDDHPARLFLRFAMDPGGKRAGGDFG